MTSLGGLATPDVPDGATLVVPLGAIEQHGPHLPVDTDARVARWLAADVVGRRDHLLLAPPLSYGASGEHEGAAGTVSVGTDALTHLLLELGRSASRWASRLLLVNGHGGNLEALRAATTQLRREGRDAAWWSPRLSRGDAHAGETETSLLLHLAPDTVHRDRLTPGDTRPLAELLPQLRRDGVLAVSPTGVLGDPTHASAAVGSRLADEFRAGLLQAVDAWRPGRDACLQAPRSAEARP